MEKTKKEKSFDNRLNSFFSLTLKRRENGNNFISRFQCRNSYERKMVHSLAEKYGMEHRSIIEYTNRIY